MNRVILMMQQFWGGLGGGFIGFFLYALFDSIFLKYDFGSIVWSIVACYVGGFVGVAVVGYIYLKKITKLHYFLKGLIINFIGLCIVIGVFFGIVHVAIHNMTAIYLLLIVFPPVVVIGGFQLGLKSEQNH